MQGGGSSWRTRPGAARGKQYSGPGAPLSREVGKATEPSERERFSLKKEMWSGYRLARVVLPKRVVPREKPLVPIGDEEGFFIAVESILLGN